MGTMAKNSAGFNVNSPSIVVWWMVLMGEPTLPATGAVLGFILVVAALNHNT
jgi:hypothetical protein